ncbi:MAG: hypothetical protein ABWW65_07860 [Thermoprotei archaeon]
MSTRDWSYDWLYSCPSILVLGSFKLLDYRGVAILNLLYPRVIILGKNNYTRIISRVPNYFYGEIVKEVCISISKGVVPRGDFLREAIANSMFYGGLNFVINRGRAEPLFFELVNTSMYKLYFKPGNGQLRETEGIDPWIMLGYGLRTGYSEFVEKACRVIGISNENACRISVEFGELVITWGNTRDLSEYIRIFPDNNPLRHVVKVKE